MPTPERKTAAALKYEGHGTPKLVAAGHGQLAERIVEAALRAGVPLREDPLLASALAGLEVGENIPPELYKAVAETLVWAYRLWSKKGDARKPLGPATLRS